MGQEVTERYGLVVRGIGPRLEQWGTKHPVPRRSLGSGWQSNQVGALQVAASSGLLPSQTELLSVVQQVGSLCALHLLPLPPLLLGNVVFLYCTL